MVYTACLTRLANISSYVYQFNSACNLAPMTQDVVEKLGFLFTRRRQDSKYPKSAACHYDDHVQSF